MADIEVAPEDIVKSVNNLKGSLSRTPDNIPAYFFKEIASSILPIWLTFLISLYLQVAYPANGKKAIITPIYKKDSHDSPSTRVSQKVMSPVNFNRFNLHIFSRNFKGV